MSWYLAFLAPLLWATSNHLDKYILGRYLKGANSSVMAIFAGLVGILFSIGILIIAPHSVFTIGVLNAVIIILNGALLIVAYVPYYAALNKEDASAVVPIYQSIPIFSFILGYFALGESVGLIHIIAGICIIVGSFFISVDFDKSGLHFKGKVLALMLLSSALIALHFLIFKFIALEETYWTTVFWEYIGASLVGVFFLVFMRQHRTQFMNVLKVNSVGIIFLNVLNEIINIVGKLLVNYASLLVPVVIVSLTNGLHPLFVFLIGLGLTLFFPSVSTEKIGRKHIVQRGIAIVILFIGTYLLVK